MNIWRLNWGEINDERPSWAPVSGQLFAIWPSPMDHDACFEAAGFTDFGDSDNAWHDDFDDVVRRLVDALEGAGTATLTEGEHPTGGWRARRSVRDALIAAAEDDTVPPCVVHFGEPATASIRASNGHPVLWVWVAEGGIDRILTTVAQDREVKQAKMKWEKLA